MIAVARTARLAGVLILAIAAARCGGETAPSCTYSVTPTAVAIPPSGGSVTINVSTADRCTWTAVSNASWFNVLPALPPGRTGSGVAQLFAVPNDSAPRLGTVAVAGQAVIVTQGAAQTYTVTGRIIETWTEVGVSGANVAVVSGQTPASVTTDRDGNYSLGPLVPGGYQIRQSRSPLQSNLATLNVVGDMKWNANMNAAVPFPVSVDDVTGYWAGGGPFPDEPMRITLIREGAGISGWYRDRRSASDGLRGTYVGRSLVFRVLVADGVLVFDCTVDDARSAHGFVKNEGVSGNYPIRLTR